MMTTVTSKQFHIASTLNEENAAKSSEKLILQLEKVTVGYDGQKIIYDADLKLYQGQIGCLLGPSGCGKSTLLRAIAGFESVISGDIYLESKRVSGTEYTVNPEHRGIGMVFQDFALFPHLSVGENIAFGIKHLKRGEQKQRVAQLLELVSLQGYEHRYPHMLSGGQQQRVALARAIAPKPKLILMDEPFSSLDIELRQDLVVEVRSILLQEGIAGILVTHDQIEAFSMADRIAVMKEGKIEQWDTGYNLYHEPETKFVADFIGHGDFLAATVIDDYSVQSALGDLKSDEPHGFVTGQTVEVLVRPDDVLHKDESEFTGTIISKRFRGSHFLYRILLPSQQALYCFASSHHDHEIGEQMGIKVDLDHLVMFAENPLQQNESVG